MMMVVIRVIGVLSAVVLGVSSIIFCFASSMSLCSPDPAERRDAVISAFWSAAILVLCIFVVFMLSACSSYEGAGFTNSGRPRSVTDCVKVDAKGNQTWYSVPLGRPCK